MLAHWFHPQLAHEHTIVLVPNYWPRACAVIRLASAAVNQNQVRLKYNKIFLFTVSEFHFNKMFRKITILSLKIRSLFKFYFVGLLSKHGRYIFNSWIKYEFGPRQWAESVYNTICHRIPSNSKACVNELYRPSYKYLYVNTAYIEGNCNTCLQRNTNCLR